MKILDRKALSMTLLVVTSMQSNAEKVDDCVTIHEQLKAMGSTEFSTKLLARGVDFKYGQFTVFAPSDELLNEDAEALINKGYSIETVNDVLLFHISAENITEGIKDPKHCNKTLLMLNEELHIDQENSTTVCSEGKVYQVGPGNEATNTLPKVSGEPIPVCHGVIYNIKKSLMLPTLKVLSSAPNTSPDILTTPNAPTKEPTRQEPPVNPPTTAPQIVPTSSGNRFFSSKMALVFAGCGAMIVALL